jgi:hypothetical protein
MFATRAGGLYATAATAALEKSCSNGGTFLTFMPEDKSRHARESREGVGQWHRRPLALRRLSTVVPAAVLLSSRLVLWQSWKTAMMVYY